MVKSVLFLISALAVSLVTVALAQGNLEKKETPKHKSLLVLSGGTLIDGTGATPVPNALLIISDGKIQHVGTQSSMAIPANATVLDTTGKTILPGLFDSHVHFRDFYAPFYLYWGVTTVGDLGNDRGWILAYRRAVKEGRAIGPNILAVGSKFNGPLKPGDPLAPGDVRGFQTFTSGNSARNLVSDRASVEKAMAEAKATGVDAIKIYNRTDPQVMKLIAEAAHRNGLRVFAHFTSASSRVGLFLGTEDVLDTGIDTYVHLFGLIKDTVPPDIRARIEKGEDIQPWSLMDTAKFPQLAQDMITRGMILNPTFGVYFGAATKLRNKFEALNDAFLKGPVAGAIPESRRAAYLPFYKPLTGMDLLQNEQGYRKASEFVKIFVDKGGKVIAGADAQGGPDHTGLRIPGLTLQMEMQMLHEAGLTPMQVIQAATKWGFEAWGKSKEVGTLEVGKRADVLILNRNPLDDMMATTDIYRVIQAGSVVDREGLAKWHPTVPPRPDPRDNYTYGLIHVPFIDEMYPESIAKNRRKTSELTITGENFTSDSVVLINNQLFVPKVAGENQIKLSIPQSFLEADGTYPLVVVRPGSAGGISNTFYLMVTPD